MSKLMTVAKRFRREEDGAAMVEYSILIGIITVATITAIIFVGGWVGTQWSGLQTKLTGAGYQAPAATP